MGVMKVDKWIETVSATDALSSITVSMDGTGGIVQFVLPPGWNVGIEGKDAQEVTDAVMGVGGKDYLMTKEAILEVCHSIGLPPKYVMRTPGPLVQSHLNYWATHSPDTDIRLLCKDDTAMVVAKAGITPFSNVEILENVIEQMTENYGLGENDLWVDQKSFHSLKETTTRFVMNTEGSTHTVAEEAWTYGVQVRNSLIGSVPLSVQGYLYRDYTDSGIITQATEGKYNRKTMGQDWTDVQSWIKQATINAMDQLPLDCETLQHAADESIAGNVGPILADTFKIYKVPLKARQPVMDELLESEEFTYFGLVKAISQSANIEELPEHMVTGLMEIAGDLAKHVSERCNSCHRVLA